MTTALPIGGLLVLQLFVVEQVPRAFIAVHELTEDGEPYRVMARLAGYHGTLAVEAFHGRYGMPIDVSHADPEDVAAFAVFLGSPERATIDAHIAGVRARLAWRFAVAAVTLAGGPEA